MIGLTLDGIEMEKYYQILFIQVNREENLFTYVSPLHPYPQR